MNPNDFRKIVKEELETVIKTQNEHGEKLDSLTAELHQVHQLADATVDIVTARYESNKREIDEIKDHLHIPKKPYFEKTP